MTASALALCASSAIIVVVITPRIIHDPTEWNGLLEQLHRPHVLQSWEWGAFKAKYGWTPSRVLFEENGRPRSAAQILRRPLPHTPFGVLYVPKGPVYDYADPPLFEQTLAGLERIVRRENGIFGKIDPDIPSSMPQPESECPPATTAYLCAHPRNDPVAADAAGASYAPASLARRFWRPSREQIQFRNTMLLDLRPSEEQLLAAMKPKTRYNIRLAQKRGVMVEPGTVADLELFYAMYAETGARDGFLIRPLAYYRDAWGGFLRAGRAQLLLARIDQEIVGGVIVFVFGGQAWYMYGASRNVHRDAMPNHLLQWQAIRWAKKFGCTTYDFWGAPDTLDETAPMYGVYRFKEGFGGRFTPHIGAYDYIAHRGLYFLYAVVRPWYLNRLRRAHATAGE